MADLDATIIAQVIRNPSVFNELISAGITREDFSDDQYQKVWSYLLRMNRDHGKIPSSRQIEARFDWVELPPTRKRDLPIQIADLKKRHEHNDLVRIMREAADMLGDPDDIDDVKGFLLQRINSLSVRNGKSSIRDLFSEEVSKEMTDEIRRRKHQKIIGLPTGLKKFDAISGGLVSGRFVATLARTGIGKTWIDLLFVREAVLAGGTVMLFPLEMTLFETALRLYTLFSQRIGGNDKVLRNTDLQMGNVTMKKVVKFLALLEDRYKGQLYVADVGSLSDPYTVDRVEAEIALHPETDMGWVDYITLMKSSERRDAAEHTKIRELSNGCKGIAQRQDIVMGVSAQANREAIRSGFLLPEPEHVGLGDSIGHDVDQLFSLARKGKYLFYGVTKNRHGPKISKTRVKFFPDTGLIEELGEDEQDNEKEGKS